MSSAHLIDRGDRWEIAASQLAVTQCCFDYAVGLTLASATASFHVHIEQPFKLCDPHRATAVIVVPERRPPDSASVVMLLDLAVDRIAAFKDGRLRVNFDGAWSIDVPPGAQYEAWTLNGPDGVLLVATPDGGLAIWS